MNPLIKEAIRIAQDFDEPIFIGATAVMLHTGEQRQSGDLDFIVSKQISNEEFLNKGYSIDLQNDEKFTPREWKIDVYCKRPLNEIPLDYIIETASTIPIDKKRTLLKVISLEGLIVSKMRAGRDQDIEDIRRLAIRCSSRINWDEIKKLAKNNAEYHNIERTIQAYAS